jgi:Zn-dependent M28 family amino/carboxypeptidase
MEKRLPFARVVATAGNPRMERLNPDGSVFQFAPGLRASGILARPAIEELFVGAPRKFADVERMGETASLRGFPLKQRVTIERETSWKTIETANVVGMVKGTDPTLAAQYVVLGAHLDHIGVGKPVGGDAIYNGALDNAAGSATLIEVAKATAAHAPSRSVLFISATAEEKGLLGAEYFASSPTVPAASIVSMIDLDMPVLTYDFTDVVAYGAQHSTVARFVAAAAEEMGVELAPDPTPEETIFVRSDHYAFVQKGVPAIMLSTGPGGEGKAAWESFLQNNYHQPSDDMALPIHWPQGARFAELNWRVMESIANADEAPRWYKGDFFGDRFAPAAPKAEREPTPPPEDASE